MSNLTLISAVQGSQRDTIVLSGLHTLVAQNGGTYTLIDASTQKIPEGVVLKRKGDDLEVEVEGKVVALIQDFYGTDVSATFSVDGTLAPADDMAVVSADSAVAGSEGESVVVWQASEAEGGIGLTTALWGGAFAGLGIALSDSDSDSDSGSDPDPVASYVVSLEAAAGPFQSVVLVELYDKEGNLLQSKEHDFSTGPVSFTIDNGYQGPLLAKVVDSNGDEGDYQDETTGELISLGSTLRAMSVADGSGDVTMSVTPLTELATQQAGVTEDNQVTEENVAVNEQIADLFGVEDILAPVTTVLDDDYSSDDGIDAAEQYGNVLATLSGADSTTGSIQETLNKLQQTIVESDEGELGLTQEGVELLQEGVDAFEAGENSERADLSDTVIDPPIINEAMSGVNSAEAEDGVIVAVQDTVAGDTVLIQWGSQAYSAVVSGDDIDDEGLANILVPADVVASVGDGTLSVTTQVNEGEVSPANIVTVDTQAPSVTITDNVDGEASGEVTYTFTFSEDVTGFDVDDIVVTGGSKGDLVAVSASEYTLVVTPDITSTDDITVDVAADVVTDLVGNRNTAAQQSVQTVEVMEVTGSFIGGPVLDGHGLTATVYNSDGVAIGSASLNADGSYKVNVRSYRGPVMIRVTDDNAAADYMDEGTGAGKDLTVDMRTVTIATSKKFSVNVNPLTELAVREMGLAGGDNATSEVVLSSLTEDQINSTNDKVAESVGLSGTDLVSADVIASINVDGSSNSAANAYGEALAVVSAMEQSGSLSTDEVLTQLANGLGDDGFDADTIQALADAGEDVLTDATDFKERIGADTSIVEPPAALAISLDSDTGDSTTDNLTQNGGYTVTGIEDGATVEFSIDNGVTWSTIQPATVEGNNSIQVRQTNSAGSSAVSTLDFTLDSTAPVIESVVFAQTALKAGESSAVTITFSEVVTSFDNSDISVNNGTLTDVSSVDGGLTWSGVFTPAVDTTDANTIISVGTALTDAAGNAPATAVDSNSIAIDTALPSVTISDDSAGTASGDVTYSFSFSEAVTGFDADDVQVAGGTKGTFTALSETEYTLVVSPDTASTADLTVDVAADVATDTAGNGNTAAAQSVQAVDTVLPTVTISDDVAGTAEGVVTYTFTFSKAVTGFIADDVVVSGGEKGTFTAVSATEYTLQITPDENSTANLTVSVPDGVATDSVGNTNEAATAASQAVDTLPPSVVIEADTVGPINGDSGDVTYTFTFSKGVTGFEAADIAVSGGSKGTFTAVSATEYTLVITPDQNNAADITVDVSAGVATDSAGRANSAAQQSVLTVDTTSPSLEITDNSAGVTSSDVTYTFTFSEAVTGFESADIAVSGGSKGTFTAVSATEYTLVVTPNAESTTDLTVDVAANVVVDAAGNGNTAATQSVQRVDTVQPTVTIDNDMVGTATGDVTYTFTFSEAVTGFTASDVVVTGGTKGTFTAVSATEYTLVVAPDVDSVNDITVDIAAGVASDEAGNGNTAATQHVQSVDTVLPTLTISDDTTGVASGDITYTFTFSEAVTGFDVSDIAVAGGTKGTFTAVSATEYTLVVTPNADSASDITVDVAANVATDAAGSGNAAATQSVQSVDTASPNVTISNDVVGAAAGDVTYTFTFSEAVTGFDSDDVVVAGGSKGLFTAVSATEYTLVVTLDGNSTTDLTVDIAAGVAIDAAGNSNAAATQHVQSVDTVQPTLTISNDVSGVAAGDVIYTFTFSEDVTGFSGDDVTVAGGSKGTFTAVSATEYTLVVTPDANSTADLTVGVAAGVATDLAGNHNSAAEQSVLSVDTVPPSVTIADDQTGTVSSISGDITYTFTFSKDVSGFDSSDVAVSGGSKGTFTAVSATEYTLVVTPNANSASNITVNVAADVAIDALGNGNEAAAQSIQAVDTVLPEVIISNDVVGTASGDVTYTFTFSKEITGFSSNDVVVTGGSKSAFMAVSPTVYTLVLTPDADSMADLLVDIAADAVTDTLGNGNTAATQHVQSVDTVLPTLIISDDTEGVTAGEVTYTFTFSEAVTGFSSDDVVVTGGSKGDFTAISATEYTLVVSPAADSTANITVDVAAGVAQDTWGNHNAVATQSVQAVDTVGPTVVITDDTAGTATSVTGDVTYTFTFSEDVTGFSADDVTVTGGTKAGSFATGSDGDTIYTLVVTPDADSTDNLTVDVAASVVTDSVGNGNEAADQSVQAVNTVLPTVAITDDLDGTANSLTGDITYTFTFSEAVTGFSVDDVTVVGGTKAGSFATGSDGDTVYTLVVTPDADSTDNLTVDVSAGVASSAVGNPNAAATQSVQVVDTQLPTVVITDSQVDTASSESGDITYTFTFSEAVTGFSVDDVTVVGGTKAGSFATGSDGDTVYTLVVTPTADSTANLTVDVAADVAQDSVGNNNVVATQNVQAVDTVLPTVAITDGEAGTASGDVTYTFTFSEAVTGFSVDDVTVTGGTKAGSFATGTDGDTVYTLVVTPAADSTTDITVNVAADVAEDGAGNNNVVATESVQTVDTVAPTVAITDDTAGTASSVTGDVTYTFTFSEAVNGFSVDDVTVVGGTKAGSFATGSDGDTVYTLVVTPDSNSTANITVDVAADVATDAAGNNNTAATQSVQAVDTQAGTVTVTNGFISDTNTIAVQNSETTTVYIVKDTVTVNSESDLTGALDAQVNSVAIAAADTNTDLSLDGLEPGNYKLYTVDDVGNVSEAAERTITVADPEVVMFDLTSGQTSNHSNRTFDAGVDYTIYIKVDTDSTEVQITDGHLWTGADNLDSGDKIILVGDAGSPLGKGGTNPTITPNPVTSGRVTTSTGIPGSSISWNSIENSGNSTVASLSANGGFYRGYKGAAGPTITLWSNITTATGLNSANMPQVGFTSTAGSSMTVSIPFSQGLAYASIDTISDDVGTVTGTNSAADSDNTRTDDTELVVKVSLNQTFTIVGDKIRLYNGTTPLGTAVTVTADDITYGYVEISTPTLSDGTSYDLNVTLIDAAGNESDASSTVTITVDTTAPTLSSSTPPDDATGVSVGDDLVLTFDEDIVLGTGNIVISDGSETLTIDVTSHNNQLSIDGNQLTINPTSDLSNSGSTYNVQIDSSAITDTAGNAYDGISDATTLNFDTAVNSAVVVFDLVNGVSSSDTNRVFQTNTEYDIYIIAPDTGTYTNTTTPAAGAIGDWGAWTGGSNLGLDDMIYIIADSGGKFDPATAISGELGKEHAFHGIDGVNNPYFGLYKGQKYYNEGLNLNDLGSFKMATYDSGSSTSTVDLWTGTMVSMVPLVGTGAPHQTMTGKAHFITTKSAAWVDNIRVTNGLLGPVPS